VRETGNIEGRVKTRSRLSITTPRAKLTLSAEQIIADYRLAVRSRAASELGRREVLAGRAPFGIFGDGKEVAQLAMAHVMRPGDWRSGYYRDQTVMLAVGVTTLEQYFAQLYADAFARRDNPHRLISTRANSQPAFGQYVKDPHTEVGRALALLVLTLDGDRISHITRFAATSALPHFGLPRTIPW